MNVTDWLIACIPIFSFGLLPVVATKIGGASVEQSLGVAFGSLLFAIIVFLIKKPELNQHIFWASLLSGLAWAVGSIGQFMGMHYLGVSKSIPISCTGQIVFTSILGIIMGDWSSAIAKMYGITALLFIIVGTVFTSYRSNKRDGNVQWSKGIMVNVISSLGFTFYVGILKLNHINGWESLLPQSFGQIAGVFLISIIFLRQFPLGGFAVKNTAGGLIWGFGNLALLLSQAKLGLAIAYSVSQTATIVSVIGGVFINKEGKNRQEWMYTIIGMLIILAGLFLIYLSSKA